MTVAEFCIKNLIANTFRPNYDKKFVTKAVSITCSHSVAIPHPIAHRKSTTMNSGKQRDYTQKAIARR